MYTFLTNSANSTLWKMYKFSPTYNMIYIYIYFVKMNLFYFFYTNCENIHKTCHCWKFIRSFTFFLHFYSDFQQYKISSYLRNVFCCQLVYVFFSSLRDTRINLLQEIASNIQILCDISLSYWFLFLYALNKTSSFFDR